MAHTQRLPREARRAQVVEAAAAAFLRGGYDGTSMDDVAAEAGVSRLILYRLFDNKPALYRAVLRTPLRALADAFADLSSDEVRELGASRLIMPVARAHPDAFRLLWRHASREPDFADMAMGFRDYVTNFARMLLARSSMRSCSSTGPRAPPAPTSWRGSAPGSTSATPLATTRRR